MANKPKRIPRRLIRANAVSHEPTTHRYELQIDLSVLDHLGINLYSNVPAVMTEMVANAWDADATEVSIDVDITADRIEVRDNGIGMTADDINKKFLTVGYRRRKDSDTGEFTEGGRPAMGRKGVGKLAPFSIASRVEVYSSKGADRCGLALTADGIKRARENGSTYYPEVLDSSSEIPGKGTLIVLSKLKNERVKRANLRARLARRFSVIGTAEFTVKIDGSDVTAKDRGDLQVLQYIWTIGDWKKPDWCDAVRQFDLPERLEGWDDSWKIRGWIGTSNKPKDLVSAAGNMNGLVVVARGRLFQENILADFNDGRHYTKYLTGQIEADFLDNGPVDIATSDRQRLIEDDPRYIQLATYIKKVLNLLETDWSKSRAIDDPKKVEEQYPQVRQWINSMADASHKKHAAKIVGAVERMELGETDKVELLKHAIFGFERMKLRGMTEDLAHALERGDAEVVKLFTDQDNLEATIYRDIIKGRLEAITLLRSAVDRDAKEREIQKILFDRLWLLDPSWERVKGTEEIEKQFRSIFPKPKNEKDEEASKGRFDITYRTVPGKHVIVELKRAGRTVDIIELAQQGKAYVRELRRLLVQHGVVKDGKNADIEVVFVLGDVLPDQIDEPESYKHQMNAISPGSRVCTYESLVTNAINSYRDYLDKTKELGELSTLVESIGGSA